jgi:hypothetical protein
MSSFTDASTSGGRFYCAGYYTGAWGTVGTTTGAGFTGWALAWLCSVTGLETGLAF